MAKIKHLLQKGDVRKGVYKRQPRSPSDGV